jgi:hypothetical protein
MCRRVFTSPSLIAYNKVIKIKKRRSSTIQRRHLTHKNVRFSNNNDPVVQHDIPNVINEGSSAEHGSSSFEYLVAGKKKGKDDLGIQGFEEGPEELRNRIEELLDAVLLVGEHSIHPWLASTSRDLSAPAEAEAIHTGFLDQTSCGNERG